MKLDHGGHLSHGMKLNVSGQALRRRRLRRARERFAARHGRRARAPRSEARPQDDRRRAGRPTRVSSTSPRSARSPTRSAPILFVDMAHFAGLVAAGEHPNPVPHADVVTTTIHKTLGGPRSGMILCREEYAKKINSAVFPGQQGGPLMHVVAGKAVALKIAASRASSASASGAPAPAPQRVAEQLLSSGVNVLTGGTDVHLVLADLRESELDGQQAEDRLDDVGITVNRNAVPFDPRPPSVSSGLRVGTPALATRGFGVRRLHRGRSHHRRGATTGSWSDELQHRAGRPRARARGAPSALPTAAPDSLGAPRLNYRRDQAARTAPGGARRARRCHGIGCADGLASHAPGLPDHRRYFRRGALSPPLFELDRVTASRGGDVVLREVSCDIRSGVTALLGPSGSGKSSLLRLLNRLADPAEGVVRFKGEDVTDAGRTRAARPRLHGAAAARPAAGHGRRQHPLRAGALRPRGGGRGAARALRPHAALRRP